MDSLTLEQKQRLTEVLEQYLCALERGVPLRIERLQADHPDLVERMEVYLESLTRLHGAAIGFRCSGAPAPVECAATESDEKRLGDFVLVREVGRGGMGIVYEAVQVSLGRRVALKVLPFAAVLDTQQIARFKNEAQAAAQLNHPNIVPVFAVGVERGVHYYAMQFIDGQPLDLAIADLRGTSRSQTEIARPGSDQPTLPRLAEQSPPSSRGSFLTAKFTARQEYFRVVIRLGIQAAEALHTAHEYGVLHRDVKPSNLLLDAEGKLWVTDFGLARCQSDLTLTRTGDVVGTRRYMSPEQASGQAVLVDQRTDVYSLGVTLYELLTLRPAFGGDDELPLARRLEASPVRPRNLQPLLPLDLETVVLKASDHLGQHDKLSSDQGGMVELAAHADAAASASLAGQAVTPGIVREEIPMDAGVALFQAFEMATTPTDEQPASETSTPQSSVTPPEAVDPPVDSAAAVGRAGIAALLATAFHANRQEDPLHHSNR